MNLPLNKERVKEYLAQAATTQADEYSVPILENNLGEYLNIAVTLPKYQSENKSKRLLSSASATLNARCMRALGLKGSITHLS